MTTIEKAIEHYWYGVTHDIFSEPVTSYANLAIEALKKQVPLKPTTFGKDLFDCAFCGRVLKRHSHNYCPKCGQALDWSE
jgi:hypothetical protein